jgi:transposase
MVEGMKPLSEDLRRRIIAAREGGESPGEVHRRFGVSRSSEARLWRQYQQSGHFRPKQIGGYRRSRLSEHEPSLRDWIKQQPDLTIDELCQRCLAELKVAIGRTALWHRLERMGLSYKKNPARRRARTARRESSTGTLAAKPNRAGRNKTGLHR